VPAPYRLVAWGVVGLWALGNWFLWFETYMSTQQLVLSIPKQASSSPLRPPPPPITTTTKPKQTASGQELADTAAIAALLEGAVLCNDSHLGAEPSGTGATTYTPNGAPTEVALITAGLKAGLVLETLKAEKPRIGAVPFESEHKFMVC